MRTPTVGLILATLLIASSSVEATTTVTVTLTINASVTFPYNEPAFTATCDVSIDAGNDAGDVLSAASCIDGWTSSTHPTFGRFLTSITGEGETDATDARNADSVRFLCGASPPNPGGPLTYASWGFGVNGAAASTGIDGYSATDGDEISFHYVVDTCTFAAFLAFAGSGTGLFSPVPLEGTASTDPGDL